MTIRSFSIGAADRPICPTCRSPVRRVHVLSGACVATCEARIRPPGKSRKERCGQHLYVLGSGGISQAIAMTKAHYEALQEAEADGRSVPPREVVEELGVFGVYEATARS